MKLVVLTTRLFHQPTSGGEICTARLLLGLRQAGHHVVLVGRGDADAARRWADTCVSIGPIERPIDEQSTARRAGAVLGALLAGLPVTVHRQGGRAAVAAAAPWLKQADAVVVDHLQAWPWLGGRTTPPRMLVQHNVESDNYRRRSRATRRGYQGQPRGRRLMQWVMSREARGLQALELQALQQAAVVACLSEEDAERMAELSQREGHAPRASLEVLPGYPLALGLVRLRPARPEGLPTIGLIGTWTWAPNREGLLWLLGRVWPLLRGHARLVLAGNGLEGLPLPPDTRTLGRVADVRQFFDEVDLVAVPSLNGSGVQEKAIEAVASGLPVVATPHALRGLGDALPPQVVRAGDPEAFAAACRRALQATGPDSEHTQAVDEWAGLRRERYEEALGRCLATLASASQPRPEEPAAGPLWADDPGAR
jgi:hypothetical protein